MLTGVHGDALARSSIQEHDEEHAEDFVPHNWPTAPHTYSMTGRFLEDRERVLGRGGRSWLAGRLVRSCDGDAQAAAAAVAAEARR